jgi:hypothetical protein
MTPLTRQALRISQSSIIRQSSSSYYYYFGPTALCWTLAAFSVSFSYTQCVGLLWWGINPSQGLYLNTEQHKLRINTHRLPFLEWNWNPRSQRSRERRYFMPRSHCDRPASFLESADTVDITFLNQKLAQPSAILVLLMIISHKNTMKTYCKVAKDYTPFSRFSLSWLWAFEMAKTIHCSYSPFAETRKS